MKRKTWILSTLMYIMVFLICFGVLHVLKKMTEPEAPSTQISEEAGQEEVPDGGAAAGDGKAVGTPSNALNAGEEGLGDEPVPEPEEQIKRETGYKGWQKKFPQVWTPEPEAEPYVPPKIILATDLHYQSAAAADGQDAFKLFVERCDGKVVQYLPELLEAFIDQVIEEKPSAVILSGDITMNGEKMNHEELAERLRPIEEAGIPVLIIPGNHDINNTNAAVYFGKEKTTAPSVNAQEFYDIYHEYGYDQAISRDENSLSYVYRLDEKNWLLMLDSAQYEPENLVEGRIKEETLAWMDEQLQKAREEGVMVIPIAHHNLLAQSRMYTTQCAMVNNNEVIDLLQKYELPLFFSGHLHVQRIRKHKAEPGVADEAYGIQEIVTDALSIPPCQYGELIWEEDGSLTYATHSVDVSAWAKRTGSTNEDLLNFEAWSEEYIENLIIAQIRGVVKNLGDEVEHSMAAVYADVYIDYYAGREIDAKGVRSTKGYIWWQRNLPDSYLLRELDSMITDADRDNNYYLLPEEQGWR